MSEPVTVKIGEQEVALVLPASYAIRYEVFLASAENQLRAWCAALGLCWKGRGRPKAVYAYAPLDYGGKVLDELVARGATPAQVAAAGVVAHNLLSAEFIPPKELQQAEDFSEAPAPSTS